MAIQTVRAFFQACGREADILEFDASSATVDLAAQALQVEPARIAKTLAFSSGNGALLVVTAGDAKVDNHKFKEQFGCKARMLPPDAVLAYTGHAVGGTCPFALTDSAVPVYLDVSLQRFATVYPACGSANSAIKLTPEEIFQYAKAVGWVDIGKGWQDKE